MSTLIDKGRSILIVDDEPANIQLLGKILEKSKYSVTYVLDGQSALDVINKKEFDLILLDVMLPDIDGFEVCRLLRENPRAADIPVIFLTARTEIENVIKGFRMGGVDYVTKPFNEMELTARIRTHMSLRVQYEVIRQEVEMLERLKQEKTTGRDLSLRLIQEAVRLLRQIDQKTTGRFSGEVSSIIKVIAEIGKINVEDEQSPEANSDDENYRKRLYRDYPGLTPNEIRLCSYLKAGLTTREISKLTRQSTRAIETARSRLRKKLKLGKDENLVHFLTQI